MKALSVKQPWAWAIVSGLKDVENRSWVTNHRGPLLIHASKRYDPAGDAFIRSLGIDVPDDLPLGGIVGRVELVGCIRDSRSPWAAERAWHWRVERARSLPFEPCRGRQQLFEHGEAVDDAPRLFGR